MCYDCRWEEKHCKHEVLYKQYGGWWKCQLCKKSFRVKEGKPVA